VLRMVEVGILDAGRQVELLRGVLTQVSPISPRHAWIESQLLGWLAAPGHHVVRAGSPLEA
jgi:hypothetical protein